MANKFKKALALVLAAAMVVTVAPAPAASTAEAASSAKITGSTSVYTGATTTYKVTGVKKTQYFKVAVTGAAKKLVTVKKGSKAIKASTKIKGTGKAVALKVTNKNAAGKKYTLKVTVYNKKNGKKVKTVKRTATVYAKTKAVSVTPADAKINIGSTAVFTATTTPEKNTKKVTWKSSNESVATVSGGTVTGKSAGTATITATSGGKSGTATVEVMEEGAVDLTISSLTPGSVNSLVAVFANEQDVTDVSLKVTKGTNTVDSTTKWDADNKTVTLTMDAKMTNGTYTVTATSASTGITASKGYEAESQYVDQLVITNEVALTGARTISSGTLEAGNAYVYYDVLDQYGQSMRTSASVEWSTSAKIAKNDKSKGLLTIVKSDDKDWVYNEQLFVTGVYTKTGKAVQKTLTIGAKQALDAIKIAGFVKKGTTTLLNTLPSDFKSGEYYIAYTVVDQNGNDMEVTTTFPKVGEDVTFVSDNVLIVEKIEAETDAAGNVTTNKLTIDGTEYAVAVIQPGMRVADGGEVTITAIANKTGNKTTLNVSVGEGVTLQSFTLGAPADVIADGEGAIIPFEAKDTNGNAVTNFVNLAKNETFNALNINASEGTLSLCEANDGTAYLWFQDKVYSAFTSDATDGIDRAISLTAVVVGGETDNEMISISDLARPEAISSVDLDEVLVEGATVTLDLDSFVFLDQYGRKMVDSYGNNRDEVKKFLSGTKISSSNSDINGYRFSVEAAYSGNSVMTDDGGHGLVSGSKLYISGSNSLTYGTVTTVTGAKTGETFGFSIAKTKEDTDTNYETFSTSKSQSVTVVDITSVRNFNVTLAKGDTIYVNTGKYADGVVASGTTLTDPVAAADDGLGVAAYNAVTDTTIVAKVNALTGLSLSAIPLLSKDLDHTNMVAVTGTYNGKTVSIPSAYINISGDKVKATTNGVPMINQLTSQLGVYATTGASVLLYSDLYDNTSAKGTSKVATGKITAEIYEAYDEDGNAKTIELGTTSILDSATASIKISDATPVATSFVGVNETAIVNPAKTFIREGKDVTTGNVTATVYDFSQSKNITQNTGITNVKDFSWIVYNMVAKASGGVITPQDYWFVVDQYGVVVNNAKFTYRVTNIAENEAGYASNNFKVSGNESDAVEITGAERGDTFDLVITANDRISTTVKVTVGSDDLAAISNGSNYYLNNLINKSGGAAGTDTTCLEYQRLQGLK